MPSSSGKGSITSRDVREIWRYAVATDFHAIDTSIATDERILGYGSEDRFLPLDHPIGQSWFTYSINSTGQWLAIPDKSNVDIYHLETGERKVLKGHTSSVSEVGFSPTAPNLLVSLAQKESHETNEDENEIIIWDVEEQRLAGESRTPTAVDEAAKVGIAAAIAHLGGSVPLSTQDIEKMEEALQLIIGRSDTRRRVPDSFRLNGRISTHFNSPLFSNSGDYLIYLPGLRPESNGDDKWDICLYHLGNRTVTTLSGHRDSIMWIGFSPDDSLIASAGWDGFFRVHDISGKEVWKWDTDHQNWAAVFSPDGKYLAGTDGAGIVRIFNLENGEETAQFDNGPRWCRTIDWSPDGNHIIVGSEAHGRLRLFAFSDGKIELAQERILSTKNSKLEDLDPSVRNMVGRMMGVHSAQFLPPPKGVEASMRLVHSVVSDEGIEVFDFNKGTKWRFVPPYNEDGSVQSAKAGDGQIALVGHIWRKDKGEIGIIAADGIRFWRLQ